MLQAEVGIDDQPLLDIIIDTVHSEIHAIDIEKEVGLNYLINIDSIILGIDIHAHTVNSEVDLDSLQELSHILIRLDLPAHFLPLMLYFMCL